MIATIRVGNAKIRLITCSAKIFCVKKTAEIGNKSVNLQS